MHLEDLRGGRAFVEAARATVPRKPVVVLKAGRMAATARAVGSLTGSLAGDDVVYDAVQDAVYDDIPRQADLLPSPAIPDAPISPWCAREAWDGHPDATRPGGQGDPAPDVVRRAERGTQAVPGGVIVDGGSGASWRSSFVGGRLRGARGDPGAGGGAAARQFAGVPGDPVTGSERP